MFGSLRIQRSRLSAEDRFRYRAAFCAGCHALHDLCGRSASLLTTYDQTVLALVLAGLGRAGEPEGRSCTALPFRTVAVQPLDAPSVALLAALDVAAVRAKLLDDVQDGDRPIVKRAVLRALRGPGARARAALVRLGFPLSLLDGLPDAQAAVERMPAPSIEHLAGPSAELTGQVFAHAGLAVGRAELAPELRAFGHALGTWVYAYDAARDLADDVRLGRFNAWVAVARTEPAGIAAFLRSAVDRATAARARLPLGAQGPIVDALLASLRGRGTPSSAVPQPALGRDRRQAGDCDCACPDAGCCEGASCCGDAGGAAPEGVSCGAGDCCCDAWCCWWTSGAQERRAVTRARRARRRGVDLADVDLAPLVGAEGEAATDLLPRGRVTVRGLTFDATAETGMIDRGARVVVCAVEGGRLRVERATR